jgi:hypothetical protein
MGERSIQKLHSIGLLSCWTLPHMHYLVMTHEPYSNNKNESQAQTPTTQSAIK